MLKNKPQPRRAGVTKSLGMAGKALGRKAPVAKPGGFKPDMPIADYDPKKFRSVLEKNAQARAKALNLPQKPSMGLGVNQPQKPGMGLGAMVGVGRALGIKKGGAVKKAAAKGKK